MLNKYIAINEISKIFLDSKSLFNLKHDINFNLKPNKKYNECKSNNILIPDYIPQYKPDTVVSNYIKTFDKARYSMLKLNSSKIDTVGIDRVKLYVNLKGIDKERCTAKILKLLNEENNSKEIIDITTGEVLYIEAFEYLNTIPNKYNIDTPIIRYGLKSIHKNNVKNFILDISTSLALHNCPNEYNLTLKELKILLNDIKEELENNGIYITYDYSKVFYLEINKNIIATDSLFKKHSHLKYLSDHVFNGKATLNPSIQTENVNSQTLSIEESRIKITLYDKSAQLYNKYNLDLNSNRLYLSNNKKIYRLEVTLKNAESIDRCFNSNLNTLLAMDDLIDSKFSNIISKKLIKEIKTHIINQYISILDLINNTSLKHIKEVYSKNQDKIFDISIFGKAIFKRYKECGKESNFAKVFNTFLNDCVNESKINKLKELQELINLFNINTGDFIDIPINVQRHINRFYKDKLTS